MIDTFRANWLGLFAPFILGLTLVTVGCGADKSADEQDSGVSTVSKKVKSSGPIAKDPRTTKEAVDQVRAVMSKTGSYKAALEETMERGEAQKNSQLEKQIQFAN